VNKAAHHTADLAYSEESEHRR